ncbi:MAG: hypothetical protein ACKVP5_19025 [Aestuariivirga sp.]
MKTILAASWICSRQSARASAVSSSRRRATGKTMLLQSIAQSITTNVTFGEVINSIFEAPSLLKNFGPKGNSLLIRAVTGYPVSPGDFRFHCGLGNDTKAGIAVRWPDRKTATFPHVGTP